MKKIILLAMISLKRKLKEFGKLHYIVVVEMRRLSLATNLRLVLLENAVRK